jgi:DNA (cytosine-5)-methyltransferase 1
VLAGELQGETGVSELTAVSLFSGIGGLDLGLERAGWTVVGQVERDPLLRSVLARHWPAVPRHDDVTTFTGWWQQEERPHVDLVAGGAPCQPFSRAGFGLGVSDERWMWPAMADAVRLVRPRWVLLENVPALLDHRDAFGYILADLAELGFDAEWSLLSACAMGAPHARDRLFVVAHANCGDGQAGMGTRQTRRVAWLTRRPRQGQPGPAEARAWRDRTDRAVAASVASDRDTDGLAGRMVEAGGNAVVPQVAEHIGRLILAAAGAPASTALSLLGRCPVCRQPVPGMASERYAHLVRLDIHLHPVVAGWCVGSRSAGDYWVRREYPKAVSS